MVYLVFSLLALVVQIACDIAHTFVPCTHQFSLHLRGFAPSLAMDVDSCLTRDNQTNTNDHVVVDSAHLGLLQCLDDNLRTHILCFLDPKDLGQVEMSCSILRRLAVDAWSFLDLIRFRYFRREATTSAKEFAVRFWWASSFCQRMEEQAQRHYNFESFDSFLSSNGNCQGCSDFPDLMDVSLLSSPRVESNMIFFRLSHVSEGALICEVYIGLGNVLLTSTLLNWRGLGDLLMLDPHQTETIPKSILANVVGDLAFTIIAQDREQPIGPCNVFHALVPSDD